MSVGEADPQMERQAGIAVDVGLVTLEEVSDHSFVPTQSAQAGAQRQGGRRRGTSRSSATRYAWLYASSQTTVECPRRSTPQECQSCPCEPVHYQGKSRTPGDRGSPGSAVDVQARERRSLPSAVRDRTTPAERRTTEVSGRSRLREDAEPRAGGTTAGPACAIAGWAGGRERT